MDSLIPGWLSTAIGIIVFFLLVAFMLGRLYRRVPPNKAMIVFGRGRGGTKGGRIFTGGGTVVFPVLEDVAFLDLGLMSLDIVVSEANTGEGVRVTVESIAQVKVGGDEDSIRTAAEQLLGKDTDQIAQIAKLSTEGHLRAIIGELTPMEIYQGREAFQSKVQEVAKADLRAMGLEVISFTVKNIGDTHGYFEAMGAAKVAEMLKDAEVGKAEAGQIQRTRVALANQAATQAELEAQVAIALATKDKDVKVAEFKATADTQRAIADLAYELQQAEIRQQLATKNGAVAIETQRQAALAAAEVISVVENQRRADVIIPAEAQRQAAIAQAGGEAEATRLRAAGEADRVRLTGEAEGGRARAVGQGEADAEKAKLLAQAEGEEKLADARSSQDEVNLRQFAIEKTLDARVKIAEAGADAVARLGSKISFTQIGGSVNGHGDGGSGNGMMDLVSQAPQLMAVLNAQSEALTGLNLRALLEETAALIRSGKQAAVTSVADEPTASPETA